MKDTPLKRFLSNIPFIGNRIKSKNENFDTFSDLEKKDDNIQIESIINKHVDNQTQEGAQYDAVNAYKQLVYGALSSDKVQRMAFFRRMAAFPEVGDAIDEICDACMNYDENRNFVNIKFRNIDTKEFGPDKIETLKAEFDEFISLYDFENNAYDLFRSMVVDGEVTFENIINPESTEEGIIGVKKIQPECYEYIVDNSYEIVGIILNSKLLLNDAGQASVDASSYSKKLMADTKINNVSNMYISRTGNNEDIIVFPKKQVTIINSGLHNENKTIMYPVLERARRAYRQLSLIEDAIIIYRLVRAPERLVFNVDTGKLPASKAEQIVKKMANKYQTKQIYDPVNGTVVNDYDPHQMMESYWFPKPEGSQGTTVESLAGAQSLGELDDLQYFLRKLYISLKIPYNRFEENSGNPKQAEETISYEEFRFAKFIMRLQSRFAKGINDAFITHLQLIGLWDKFKLNNRSFFIEFIPPSTYDLYRSQQIIKIKMETYNSIIEDESFSKDVAKRKYLDMTENDIMENNKGLEMEAIRAALLERKISNIKETGLPIDPITGGTATTSNSGEDSSSSDESFNSDT